MPAPAQAKVNTDLDIDRGTHTIRFTRVFDGSPLAIFQAWTEPEQVTCWWDAAGDPLAVCEIDLRVGGAFKFVTNSRPDMPFMGTYSEISPPDRLVFEALGSTGRVLLRQAADKSVMTVEIECRSAEQLDQFLKMGVGADTSETLDNLVAYAGRRGAAAA